MSPAVPYYIVDVFAEKKYAGNPLAVVLDADRIADEEMQAIARETNYSETTFVYRAPTADGGYRVRIFTPAEEIPFAGHPTIGTAFLIQQTLLEGARVAELTLHLGVGPISVAFDYDDDGAPDRLWMRHPKPTFGRTVPRRQIADALRLDVDDLEEQWPIEEASTGLPALIVPVRTLEAARRIRADRDKLLKLVDGIDAKVVLAFARQSVEPGNDVHVRVFVDYFGIPEDPATGSANGALVAYLLRHRLYGDSFRLRAEQGYAVNRPSLLMLQGDAKGGATDIVVGGRCFLVASGDWRVGSAAR
ncbi:PhzF family phenazine biosynthesis protein [Paenibacillus sp. TRM 82003]|nr:PhzF family phenazine biosynthesis protein [Paenibacillus sp. TRM 82003]